jgi:hypothetical protein
MLKFILHTITITDEHKRSILSKWAGIEPYIDSSGNQYPIGHYGPDSLCIEIEIDAATDQAFQAILAGKTEQSVKVKISLLKDEVIMHGVSAALNANFNRKDSKGAIFHLENIMGYLDMSSDVFGDIRKAISESLISAYGTSEISLIRAKSILDFESPFQDKTFYEDMSSVLYLLPWVCKYYERGFRGIRIECDLGVLRVRRLSPFEIAFSSNSERIRHEWISISGSYFLDASEPRSGPAGETGTRVNPQMSCGTITLPAHYNPGSLLSDVIVGDPGEQTDFQFIKQ